MTAGRPTKYNPDELEHVTQLCMMGATNEKLACLLNVATSTVDLWIQKHEEFSGAVKKGREYADMAVAQSLYDKAIKGDVTAIIFWLKNRLQDKWRDQSNVKHEHEFTAKITQAQETLDEKLDAAFASRTPEGSGKPN